jgi:type IX secretion system PorP/SprF family membrane protein
MRHLTSLLFALMVSALAAQQLPQLSQYAFNDYIYNPAVAGSRPWFELRTGHRYQWVGITDSPRTFTLSGTTPIGSKMGVGGLIYTDHVGPTRRTGFQASYAYHLNITEDIRLSMALSVGMLQFVVDGSKIHFHDGSDPVIDDQLRGDLVPDATFGIMAYHEKWWAGAAAPQLMKGKIYFYDEQEEALSELATHYYVMGGYRWQFADDFRLEPSVLVKYVDPVPAKVDITATLHYRELLWLGLTYRTKDAMSVMVGGWVKETFQFGYSYDITTTNLKNYSDGTHEIMLAITFAKEKSGGAPATPAP